MRAIFAVADVHIGNHRVFATPPRAGVNDRAQETADILRRAVYRASSQGALALLVCGDLADTDDLSPQLLALVAEVLSESTVPIVLLVGNHDQRSAQAGDHALGVLGAIPGVRVFDSPGVLPLGHGVDAADVLVVPFQQQHAATYIPEVARDLAAKTRPGARRVLAAHAGVLDERTSPWLRDSHEAIPADVLLDLLVELSVGVAFLGNWHDRRTWVRSTHRVMQVGALCPTGFDNPGGAGLYGSLAWWADADDYGTEELPGPRFFNVTTETELRRALADTSATRRLISYRNLPPDRLGVTAKYLAGLQQQGLIAGFRVSEDKGVTESQRVSAATTAQSATNLEDALARFVARTPLPQGVTPPEVLGEARRFLGYTSISTERP